MRTEHVETFETVPGSWRTETLDVCGPIHAIGSTELEAWGAPCDRLYERQFAPAWYADEVK